MGIAGLAQKEFRLGVQLAASRPQLIMVALHKAPLVIWPHKDHTSGSAGILCRTLTRVQNFCFKLKFNTNVLVSASKQQQEMLQNLDTQTEQRLHT